MSLIHAPRPTFSPDDARALLREHFALDGTLAPLDSERDQNFRVDAAAGVYTLKIHTSAEPPGAVAFQTALLEHVAAHAPDLPLPRIVRTRDGQAVARVHSRTGAPHAARLVTYLAGTPLASASGGAATLADLGRVLGRLDGVLGSLGHPGAFRDFDWHVDHTLRARGRLDAIRDPARRQLLGAWLDAFEARVAPALPHLRHSVVHNDANDWNVLVDPATGLVSGLIDFGDATFAPTIAELAIAGAYAMLAGGDPAGRVAALVRGYHGVFPITTAEARLLPDLIAARLAVSVSISALRHATSDDPYLFVSEAPAWTALEWLAGDGGARLGAEIRRIAGVDATLPPRAASATLAEARRQRLGRNLSLSYREPLHIVSGEDVWLVAADGRRYLDCYNNVAHVGHCHPAVVAAIAAQARRLNTNTRYLHENVLAYAERLRETLPPGLDRFFFVNSGSEANDLALRIARTATGRQAIAVLDWAYHGHTQALIEISPYKYKRRGGPGRLPFVIELPLPDPYRAPDDWTLVEHGARFAAEARRDLRAGLEAAGPPAAFIAETIPSVGGQVFLPDGYLAEVHEAVRGAGGLCIADEVQVGFGRIGRHMWAFQAHGVVPDIVTMGKPAGAGHPLGIVATTRALADAFANGMEYFNTFGGNPVSCAAGLAVLDVLRDECLIENAVTEGDHLMGRFRALADRHLCIGDVRGQGLFFGLEVVRDRASKTPDGETASAVVQRAKALGVLTGTDGPHDNVIKLRPPMTFRREHSDLLVDVLDRAFATSGRAW